jgi:hypothetical protein
VESTPTRYSIEFKDGGNAYLDRKTLDLIYFNADMKDGTDEYGVPLSSAYGNSRDAGADYKCKKDSSKI